MWIIKCITVLVFIPAICLAHERIKKAIENNSKNQKPFDGYNYPTPSKPFDLPTKAQSSRPATVTTTSFTKFRPSSTSSSKINYSSVTPTYTSSSQQPSFPQKVSTLSISSQTNFKPDEKNVPPSIRIGYIYTTPNQPFTFPNSNFNPTEKISIPKKPILDAGTNPSYVSLTSTSTPRFSSTKQPYFPNTLSSSKPPVQFTKPSKVYPKSPEVGYVYTTPKTPFSISPSTSHLPQLPPKKSKTSPQLPLNKPSSTKQPYFPNTFSSSKASVQFSKPTTVSTVPSLQKGNTKSPDVGYVYTTLKTPFSISSSTSLSPQLPQKKIQTSPQLSLNITPHPITQSVYISPLQPIKPTYVPSFPQSSLKPISISVPASFTKPPYLLSNLPSTTFPTPSRVSTQSSYTLPPFSRRQPPIIQETTKLPSSLLTTKLTSLRPSLQPHPSTQTLHVTFKYSPALSTKPPGYLPPIPTNIPFISSHQTSPPTSRFPSQPGSGPPEPTPTNVPFIPSLQTSQSIPRFPSQPSNRPPKPTQTNVPSIPSIQTSPSVTRLPSQPGSRPPPYLPPSSPRPNYPTITPPPYPTPLYSITPSTSSLPPPTGFPAAPPTIPPSTFRPNVGYNYQIPDLPFEFRRR